MRRHYFPLLDTRSWLWAAAITAMAALAGCSSEIATEQLTSNVLPPVDNPITETNQSLRDLPAPRQPVVVAVYSYTDQTGQFKPNESAQTLSRAVTQGATSILIKALQDVGKGDWFTVVERERIDNLLKERAIVTQMRMTYLGEKESTPRRCRPCSMRGSFLKAASSAMTATSRPAASAPGFWASAATPNTSSIRSPSIFARSARSRARSWPRSRPTRPSHRSACRAACSNTSLSTSCSRRRPG